MPDVKMYKMFDVKMHHLPLSSLTRVLPQEPGRI